MQSYICMPACICANMLHLEFRAQDVSRGKHIEHSEERENVSFTSWGAFRIPTAPTQSRLCTAHAE